MTAIATLSKLFVVLGEDTMLLGCELRKHGGFCLTASKPLRGGLH